jgi:hypothetical protein
MEMSGQLQTPAALPPTKKPGRRGGDKNLIHTWTRYTDYVIPAHQYHRYPLYMTIGGYQIKSGSCGEERKIFCPLRKSNPDSLTKTKTKLNSLACSPQANYTDRAAAAC